MKTGKKETEKSKKFPVPENVGMLLLFLAILSLVVFAISVTFALATRNIVAIVWTTLIMGIVGILMAIPIMGQHATCNPAND